MFTWTSRYLLKLKIFLLGSSEAFRCEWMHSWITIWKNLKDSWGVYFVDIFLLSVRVWNAVSSNTHIESLEMKTPLMFTNVFFSLFFCCLDAVAQHFPTSLCLSIKAKEADWLSTPLRFSRAIDLRRSILRAGQMDEWGFRVEALGSSPKLGQY